MTTAPVDLAVTTSESACFRSAAVVSSSSSSLSTSPDTNHNGFLEAAANRDLAPVGCPLPATVPGPSMRQSCVVEAIKFTVRHATFPTRTIDWNLVKSRQPCAGLIFRKGDGCFGALNHTT